MAENYSSEWDLPLSSLFGKRRLIRREVNALNLMSKLGEDLLVEILIRLPNPKSSCRCKAVCKRWRSLISDPSFNRRFIAHHRSKYQPPSLFIPSHDPQSVLSFLPLPDNARPNLRVFDCFKDLLLCGFVDTCDELRTSYLVCNPFTKQWIALPLAPRTQGYFRSAALLVCQPRSNYNLVADDEPESAAFVYSEYRFRVVLLLQCGSNMTLQVFCSESSTWRQGSRKNVIMSSTNVVWWNELLVWVHYDMPSNRSVVLGYDPFRLDIRPDPMTAPSSLLNRLIDLRGTFSISQGVFHSIVLKVEGVGDRSRMGTGEPVFHSAVKLHCYHPIWKALQPRVSCWPTPIPRYDDLRGMYDGSYDCWVQNTTTATRTLPSSTINGRRKIAGINLSNWRF